MTRADDAKYARDVLRAETANMKWEDWIKETVDRAPPLSSETIAKLRVLFGYGAAAEKSYTQGCTSCTPWCTIDL